MNVLKIQQTQYELQVPRVLVFLQSPRLRPRKRRLTPTMRLTRELYKRYFKNFHRIFLVLQASGFQDPLGRMAGAVILVTFL